MPNSLIPDVSAIITNYNYGKYIARCVRSCLSQRNVTCEVIVVDDASDDNSYEEIKQFFDGTKNIKYVNSECNAGVAAASNKGLEKSQGRYVIRVDADDFVSADMCHFLKTYLEANHDAACVSCDYILIDDHENVIKRCYADEAPISCGIMYRRDLLVRAGGYNPSFRHREEEELRKRLGEFYAVHHLRIPFYRYRMHDSNKTKSAEYAKTIV